MIHTEDLTKNEFMCPECDKKYTQNKSLRRHIKESHPEKLLEDLAPTMRNVKQYESTISCASIEEFQKWKMEVELKTNSKFVEAKGPFSSEGGTNWHYVCHWSGLYSPRGDGVRALNKLSRCAAIIKVMEMPSGQCEVKYSLIHSGHDLELAKLKNEEETKPVSELTSIVPSERISKNTKTFKTNSQPEKNNIGHQFSIKTDFDDTLAVKIQILQERWNSALNSVTDLEGALVLEQHMSAIEAALDDLSFNGASCPQPLIVYEKNDRKRKLEPH